MKKVIGVLIILLGILLIMSVINGIFNFKIGSTYNSNAYKGAYIFGSVVTWVLITIAGIALIRWGRKWINRRG